MCHKCEYNESGVQPTNGMDHATVHLGYCYPTSGRRVLALPSPTSIVDAPLLRRREQRDDTGHGAFTPTHAGQSGDRGPAWRSWTSGRQHNVAVIYESMRRANLLLQQRVKRR